MKRVIRSQAVVVQAVRPFTTDITGKFTAMIGEMKKQSSGGTNLGGQNERRGAPTSGGYEQHPSRQSRGQRPESQSQQYTRGQFQKERQMFEPQTSTTVIDPKKDRPDQLDSSNFDQSYSRLPYRHNQDRSQSSVARPRDLHFNTHQLSTPLLRTNKASQAPEFLRDDDNNWKKEYIRFLIANGFSESGDLTEQFDFLEKSKEIQYDPDDPKGLRLPSSHAGRENYEFSEKERYTGRKFHRETMEFEHFHKSFYLDSVPSFPDRQYHAPPTGEDAERAKENGGRVENAENTGKLTTGLYLPHATQWLPTWTLKKKIAKTYGPGYVNYITMPPMKLPTEDEFDAMLEQRLQEKQWKKKAVHDIIDIETRTDDQSLAHYLSDRLSTQANSKWKGTKFGAGDPYAQKRDDFVPRQYEIWDVDMCYELKTEGDPQIPNEFKDEVFRQFITSIDRNGSLAPWQKNYAFSLLPKAFGGPQGEYLETIFGRMKPKEEKITYKLKQREAAEREGAKFQPKAPKKTKKPKRPREDLSAVGL